MALISCPECGKQMSDKAAACPHCGAPASAPGAAAERKCAECGASLPEGAAVCPTCGCPVEEELAKPTQQAQTTQPAEPTYIAPPAQPIQPQYQQPVPSVSAEEQFENVIIKGKKSPAGRIVSSIVAGLLWAAAIAALGCVIYDWSFADSIGGFLYYGEYRAYYSSLAGGMLKEQYWLIIGLAAAAFFALVGAVVFIAGLGKRVKVTNARVVIKRPFRPTAGLTWDRVEMAAKETDTSFVVKSGEKKYRIAKLLNQEEVFGVITDMLSRKSSGTLKMPAAYGAKSAFGKLWRKKALVITAASVVVVGIAAAVLSPVILPLFARQVTNVAYEWNVKELRDLGGLDGEYKVFERTITGCYSGGWLNGKPCGTGTFLSDSGNYSPFREGDSFTGTWKNGEPCEGTVVHEYSRGEFEVYDGSFRHSKMHGQGKFTNGLGFVEEGEFRYGHFLNGTVTNQNGEVIQTYKNGKEVK